jgi:hypothetical protein
MTAFCRDCQNIFNTKDIPPTGIYNLKWKQENIFDDALAAAKNGCWLCSRFVRRCNADLDVNSNDIKNITVACRTYPTSWSARTIELNVSTHTADGDFDGVSRLTLNMYTDLALPANQQYDQNTRSEKTWAFIQNSLETCSRHHKTPATPVGEWYPTRLLEVKLSNDGPTFRLVLNSSIQRTRPYITLSHRWGGTDMIKLTATTINEFLNEIPRAKLPQTFKDACEIAHCLNAYIWIDSLV